MTDGTADDDSPESTSPTPEQYEALQKQLAELAERSDLSEARRQEAVRAMNASQQAAAEERKRIEAERAEEESSAISGKELAQLQDDPEEFAKFLANRESKLRAKLRAENAANLAETVKSLSDEVVQVIVDRDRKSEAKFRSLDPRFNSQDFEEAREKWPTDQFTDEQVLVIMEKDGKGRPPGAVAGPARSSAQSRKTELTELDVQRKTYFGAALDRLDKEAERQKGAAR
ncbi:MAG: hypothetical protein O3A47_04170 [Chloroflexi bacterium]|nr:hypothetical protein [Chloroflexota bacterium]